jgi:hypothetical protein
MTVFADSETEVDELVRTGGQRRLGHVTSSCQRPYLNALAAFFQLNLWAVVGGLAGGSLDS